MAADPSDTSAATNTAITARQTAMGTYITSVNTAAATFETARQTYLTALRTAEGTLNTALNAAGHA